MSAGFTTLDAVNAMLGAIGEAPVSTLGSADADASNAQRILDRVNRQIQAQGWACNTEKRVTYALNASGQVELPDSVLRVDSCDEDSNINVARRGKLLYNLDDHTTVFATCPKLRIITLLDLADVTAALQNYITAQAAREFQQEMQGSITGDQFTAEAVGEKRIDALHEDAENAGWTLRDNPDTRSILGDRNHVILDP